MEAALLSGLINIILTKFVPLAEERYKLQKDIKSNMEFLKKELVMISGVLDQQPSPGIGSPEAVLSLTICELRKLAHDIEDCIDRLMYRVTWEQQAPLWRRAVGSSKRLPTRQQIAEEMKRLRETPVEVHNRSGRYKELAGQTPSFRLAESSSSSSSSSDEVLVGMNVPLKELLEQLTEAAEGQPKRLKVISIVGFRGSGKTALARKVYNSQIGQQFRLRAWVCAANMGPREVLMEILRELGRPVRDTSEVSQLGAELRVYMDKQRYLIVIDDMTTDHWSTIKSAFPTDGNFGSRILVTTTVQSIANACSSSNGYDGYVHKMRRLDEEHSKELFLKKACLAGYEEYGHEDSERVLKKCGGQALALVTVGQFLRKKDWPTGPSCNDVCRQLRHHLEKDDTLQRMRRVLDHDYTSLSDHASKTCLLYFGMFPSDHPIKRNRLMRRWLAEGFLGTEPSCVALDPAAENFKKLMDRNIIEPIDVSHNEKVKTCKTYGMMREFILIKSKYENFVTLLDDETRPETRYVRRISLHHYSVADDSSLNIDLSLVRSLTIFGKAGNAMLEFREYQLLRVLDLEECTDLGDDHLKGVCNLLLLKYLSLGGTVTSLPKEIEKLKHLETLDLRRTEVKILPIEVIMLPCLIHLFGKFKLSDRVKITSEVKKFFSTGQSNLETLAGFLTDESHGFPQVMEHMKNLRKVKIWCEKTASSTNLTYLEQAIQKFIHDEKEEREKPRTLSLHFDQCSEDLLSSLKAPCHLTSLTLQGKLPKLPQFVTSMHGLSELCLSSTILTKGLLQALSELRYLQYLKLVADNLEKFVIKEFVTDSGKIKSFPRLLRLCFELQFPTFPTIEEGALKFLHTLQLLCKDIDGLSGIKIECLKRLKEVTLLPGVKRETREIWEKAAQEHPNRPKVLLLKSVDTAQSEPTDDSVAPEQAKIESTENSAASQGSIQETAQIRDNQGSGSSSIPKKQNNCAVQSSAHDELNSALNNMGEPEVSSLIELSFARNGMVPS